MAYTPDRAPRTVSVRSIPYSLLVQSLPRQTTWRGLSQTWVPSTVLARRNPTRTPHRPCEALEVWR